MQKCMKAQMDYSIFTQMYDGNLKEMETNSC